MLTALAIQWLTVQVSASRASAPAVIIAGADEITRPHLERLSDACERRRVPLTLMFRHLREDALHMLGGGTAAFMRLGNHAEAEQAASYIGRQHKFVLSQLTATVGREPDLHPQRHRRLRRQRHLLPQLAGIPPRPRQPVPRDLHLPELVHRVSPGPTAPAGATPTATQRVYEYAVEPAVLQNLPDHALLLAVRGPAGPQLQAVECDPAIATLPGVIPQVPMPRPVPTRVDDAQLPPATPPAWPTASSGSPRSPTCSRPRDHGGRRVATVLNATGGFQRGCDIYAVENVMPSE